MEVRPGYKQTEAGLLPEEWAVSTVGHEFEVKLGKMLDADRNAGTPKPYLGNRAVQWDRIDISDLPTVPMSRADIDRYRLQRGDLLVCEGGEVGRCAIWESPLDECYYQKALHRLRPLRGFDPRVMAALLRSWSDRGLLANYVTQTSIAHLPREKFIEVPLPVPPPEEQRAIATALSDMDALLAGLDRFVAKKRDLKQAAMQQLLTGQTRLPGFQGEWEVRALHEVCQKIQDGTHFSPKLGGSDYLYVTSKNIRFGKLDLSTAEHISAAEHFKIYARCDVKKGDLLLTKDGANTGNAALNPLDEPFSLLSSVAMLRFDSRHHVPAYFMHQILSNFGQAQINEAMSGNAITRLTLQKIRALRFPVASHAEQAAIAGILTDMDAELTALETRRDKTRALKQGMMQELLTGRTRLV